MTRDANAVAASAPSAESAGGSADLRELRLQRNLKILVGALGLLILAGLLTVVGRIIYLASTGAKPGAHSAAAALPTAASPRDIPLELPKGARVVSISVAGNRLAVHHESPSGAGITIIDTDTGQRLADVRPREAMPGQ